MTIFSSCSANHISSWQLTVSMHQIDSLICNQHYKLMVKMTILLILCAVVNNSPVCETNIHTCITMQKLFKMSQNDSL